MKASVAKILCAALLAAPLASLAQNLIRPADSLGQFTLLAGPKLTSPATATGEVVPGQKWVLKKSSVTSATKPSGPLSLGTWRFIPFGESLNLQGNSSVPKVAAGTLTFRPASGAPKESENFFRRLKTLPPPVDQESFRFDATFPKTEIRPLQKKPATAQGDVKSL